jgi:hypothetical protein
MDRQHEAGGAEFVLALAGGQGLTPSAHRRADGGVLMLGGVAPQGLTRGPDLGQGGCWI